ncbi:PE-PGRS family protein [Streptomyces sp. NPDC057654]|uniref:PE-PGRS family protein n=1 Tax=Streptomyces sp. NPDC057654 TaxID=3346196 RepID=UPI003689130B
MADFHRPPEWQQPADRHTQLTDPVITVRQLSRFEYSTRKRLSRIDHALVFATPDGSYEAYLPPHRPSRSEVMSRRYTAMYEVDMGVHAVHLELALPSDIDAFEFGAVIDLSWQVEDPARFVESRERDVPALLTRQLQQLLRSVSRRYPVERSAEAERAVQDAVDSRGPFGADAGLRVGCAVRLRLDDDAIAHQRELRTIRYAEEVLDPGHALRMRRQRREHEFEVERAQQEQELNAQKIAFYQYHLEQGGVAAWALHLAQHPEDSRLVMESMRADQLEMIRNQMHLATEVMKGNGLEEYQMEEPKKLALKVVNDILNQRLPGVPAAPQAPAPGAREPREALRSGEPEQPGQQQPGPYAPPQPYAPPGPYAPPVPPVPPVPPQAGAQQDAPRQETPQQAPADGVPLSKPHPRH